MMKGMSVRMKGGLATAAVTVAIAVGAGHVMQYGFSGASFGNEVEAPPAPRPNRPSRPTVMTAETPIYSPLLPAAAIMPELPDAAVEPSAFPTTSLASIDVPAETPLHQEPEVLTRSLVCQPEATARAMPGAIVRVTVRACQSGAQVDLTHAGLEISKTAGPSGHVSLDVPALSSNADLAIRIGGQAPIHLSAAVPDVIWSERVAVVSDGSASVSVRADGSAEGEDVQMFGTGGLQNLITEVHTFAAGQEAIALSVVAEATAANCGREVPMRILRSTAENAPQDATFSVAFPPCDTLGEFVVLKNLSEDLTVAQN